MVDGGSIAKAQWPTALMLGVFVVLCLPVQLCWS